MTRSRRSYYITILGVALVLLTLAVPVAGAITFTVDTAYEGTEGDSQAVQTTVEVSPEGSAITNVTVVVSETNNGFVDEQSFTRSLDPATSEATVEYQGNGRYTIDRLVPGESVTIEFNAYPKTIQSKNLHVANVRIEYVQNGQELSEQKRVEADLSSSSYFAYQDAKRQLQNQQTLFYAAGVVLAIVVLYVLYRIYIRFTGFDNEDEFDSNR